MDVGCSLKPISTTAMTLQHYSGSGLPQFPQIHPQPTCKGTPICYKHASISITTHEIVFVILYSTNWMIIGLCGGIEYKPEDNKLTVMSQS